MVTVPTIQDDKLCVEIDVSEETLRTAPLSGTGETRLLSGKGSTVTISHHGVPMQLRALCYFPADEIIDGVQGPERVLEALQKQVEAFGAMGRKPNAAKHDLAQAKLDALEAKIKAARK